MDERDKQFLSVFETGGNRNVHALDILVQAGFANH
jgi:hypothetical protein